MNIFADSARALCRSDPAAAGLLWPNLSCRRESGSCVATHGNVSSVQSCDGNGGWSFVLDPRSPSTLADRQRMVQRKLSETAKKPVELCLYEEGSCFDGTLRYRLDK